MNEFYIRDFSPTDKILRDSCIETMPRNYLVHRLLTEQASFVVDLP